MCTVTYIPSENGCFLSSSRDEKTIRKPAFVPKAYQHNNATLLFPKDAGAGGTWIAVNQNGNAAVLLNGGFEKHIPIPPYARSRGLVFLDVIAAETPFGFFQELQLGNIEPFTLIIIAQKKIMECRWSGSEKQCREIDKNSAHIWSSVTLYNQQAIHKREKWFRDWRVMHSKPSIEEILHFHQFAGEGDPENAIRMNRSNQVLTVSITGITMDLNNAILTYQDLQQNITVTEEMPFVKQRIIAL
ncbi:MAG: NRDE family protein [Bacteroidota bacterium]